MAAAPMNALPQYPPGYEPATSGYVNTINTRAFVGYLKWGFVIYRGTYKDDKLWEKCIALLKSNIAYWLRERGQADLLEPDLVWTIIEDRNTLDGAPSKAVRARFREWIASRSVERDGPGADGRFVDTYIPRFRFCIYVDQASLDSLSAEWAPASVGYYWSLKGQVAVINGTHGHHDEDDPHGIEAEYDNDDGESDEKEDEYPPIEGNTAEDVGWRYADAGLLVAWYEALHRKGRMDWEVWRLFYASKRPYAPVSGHAGTPLASVDLSR